MIKLNIEKTKIEYLKDLYSTISKNLQFDYEFLAVADIVDKMYELNKDLATKWTLDLINRYGIQGLKDSELGFDTKAAVRSFIERLIDGLCKNYTIDKVILLIHDSVGLYEVRFLLWSYLFGVNNRFNDYFDSLLNKKKYLEAKIMVHKVLENQGYIPYEVFDAVTFLNDIISKYTCSKDKIKNQQVLDLLYSLIDFIPDDFNRAVLKSNFIEYI